MTPLVFEQRYQAEWDRLGAALVGLRSGKPRESGEQFTALYRRACEQLALARARGYPAHLVGRLEELTAEAHQTIYQQHDWGWRRVWTFLARDFPRSVRAHAAYVWIAAAVFVLPMVALGILVYLRPELILSMVDARTADQYEQMYSRAQDSIGRLRNAGGDWAMFGLYIRNNIGIAFQCFAGGLFAGVGSLFFLAFNGASFGAVAGYLTEQGLAGTFYSFVVTHGAFELTAIVLAGAAGLRIGHALLKPGRRTRLHSLVAASKDAVQIVYGVTAMLLVAAAIEAFWSSAGWIPLSLKYSIAAIAWMAVLGYLTLQGRHAD